jgi:pyruvate carboxylase
LCFKKRRDRATKILTYIADITVNGHPETVGRQRPPKRHAALRAPEPRSAPQDGLRQMLLRDGPQSIADWMTRQTRVLITDTTMRDGHQSLLATACVP